MSVERCLRVRAFVFIPHSFNMHNGMEHFTFHVSEDVATAFHFFQQFLAGFKIYEWSGKSDKYCLVDPSQSIQDMKGTTIVDGTTVVVKQWYFIADEDFELAEQHLEEKFISYTDPPVAWRHDLNKMCETLEKRKPLLEDLTQAKDQLEAFEWMVRNHGIAAAPPTDNETLAELYVTHFSEPLYRLIITKHKLEHQVLQIGERLKRMDWTEERREQGVIKIIREKEKYLIERVMKHRAWFQSSGKCNIENCEVGSMKSKGSGGQSIKSIGSGWGHSQSVKSSKTSRSDRIISEERMQMAAERGKLSKERKLLEQERTMWTNEVNRLRDERERWTKERELLQSVEDLERFRRTSEWAEAHQKKKSRKQSTISTSSSQRSSSWYNKVFKYA